MVVLLFDSLFIVPPVSVFNPCFDIQYFVSFLFCNRLDGEEKADCFTLNVFLCLVTVSVLVCSV